MAQAAFKLEEASVHTPGLPFSPAQDISWGDSIYIKAPWSVMATRLNHSSPT